MKNIIRAFSLLMILILSACSLESVETAVDTAVQTQQEILSGQESSEENTLAAPTTDSVAETLAENSQVDLDDAALDWNEEDVIQIVFNGDSVTGSGDGVSIAGQLVTITKAGTYSLSGTLNDGQVMVDSSDDEVVRLILNGVDLSSSTSAPISISQAGSAALVLAQGTENRVTDAATYVFASTEEDEPNAAVFSKADLTILGEGSLIVNGNFNDGIASKDGLLITGGIISVTAVDDGIRGKDYLSVTDGNITLNTGGDGLKSDNEEDTAKGFIAISGGVFSITAGGDAITAQTDVTISAGEFSLVSGGGAGAQITEDLSAKGIKGLVNVNIDGGTFVINAADDGVHSNANIVINAGNLSVASGDDGMHADATLTINGGFIDVSESYEGLESALITINDGEIHINSSDDGINIAGGADGSGIGRGMMGREMMSGSQQRPDASQGGAQQQPSAVPQGGAPQGGNQQQPSNIPQGDTLPGSVQETFASAGDYYLYINGGYIVVNASGDGIDSNGSIEMNGGVVIVNGPTESMNGALDYMGAFNITGGAFIAAGSAGMALAPSDTSSQNSLMINLTSDLPAGTLIHLQDEAGSDVLTFELSKTTQSIVFSSAALAQGTTYEFYTGGSSNGTEMDGLYNGGQYSGGQLYTSLTLESAVTVIGGGSGWGRRR
jgi:hypothetical protein